MHEPVLVMCDLGDEVNKRLAGDPQVRLSADCGCDDAVKMVIVRSGVRVDDMFLDRYPKLTTVVRAGNGLDNIEQDALERRNITLTRRPGESADAVAGLTLAALSVLARKVPAGQAGLARGNWLKSDLVGDRLSELGVAIWGAGAVGQSCATLLEPLVSWVSFATWPSASPALKQAASGVLETDADVHVLALPLRSATTGMFGPDWLSRIEGRAPYVLNVGRFELLDFGRAIVQLARGSLRGLFVDPVDASHVPMVAPELATNPGLNLLVSPHLGAQRRDVLSALGDWLFEQIDQSEFRGGQ